MIYQSEVMATLIKMVDRIAPSNATVHICGESGTGKELIARRIHEKSSRATKPLVSINCGALRETLLESELFGHEKGSFTGAYTRKIGLAEIANGGTLFLDEINELTSGMQAKLLRFLQEGEIYRVGGKEPIQIDVRVISATNSDLESEVNKGNFREDLFYRINAITVHVPPLRKRKEDIPLLINHFLDHKQFPTGPTKVNAAAMLVLTDCPWYGNIRELQNFCYRAKILTEGDTIKITDIPDSVLNLKEPKEEGYNPETPLFEVEKNHVLKVVKHFEGDKRKAAEALGLTIKTLYNRLHGYGALE